MPCARWSALRGSPAMADVKFCGLTQAVDADRAVALGAAYCGVIFAGGPRTLSILQARTVLAGVSGARRVGVFADLPAADIAHVAEAVGLDVVQLAADPSPGTVAAVRAVFGGLVWASVRCAGPVLPDDAERLFATADAVVLDARIPGALGGTGTTLPWLTLADAVRTARGRVGQLVLAGGLTDATVPTAIAALDPDVVDVSSGVESAPGIKDHERMRRFVAAASYGSRRVPP